MKKLILSFIVLTLGFFSSCTKDLEALNYSDINPSIFPQTEKDLQAMVMACYYPLRGSWSNGLHTTSERGLLWMDVTTGILRNSSNDQRLNFTKTSVTAVRIYDTFYNKISLMTTTIDEIQNSKVGSPEFKKKAIAEIRGLRGYLGYVLFDLYGPIVIAPLEVLKSPLEAKPLARLSHADMVKFIEDDLNAAAADLPAPKDAEYGRISKGLAKMMLVRLYLHEKNWAKVLSTANEIIAYNHYVLDNNYLDIFKIGGQKASKEVIWAVPADYQGTSENQWQLMALPANFPGIAGFGGTTSTWWFYDTFEPADVRKTNLITEYTGTTGVKYDRSNIATYSFIRNGPLALKIDLDDKRTTSLSTVDIVIYRYPDVLLSKAEAIANISGPNAEALELLNVIRRRAKLGNLSLANVGTLPLFNAAVLMERQHEYWCENGQLRADLIRMGEYQNRAILVGGTAAIPFATANKNVMPFSQVRVDEGKGLFIQNPGYDQ
ncbi:MAG: RagB/SusD family nutrient uptake outer membrane protein [Bacteroidota bacterium]